MNQKSKPNHAHHHNKEIYPKPDFLSPQNIQIIRPTTNVAIIPRGPTYMDSITKMYRLFMTIH